MTQAAIVFICNDSNDVHKCLLNVPRHRLFTRFFLYLGDKGVNESKQLITDKDRFLSLHNSDPSIIIRAGILLNNEMEIIFTHANHLPSITDIENSIVEITNNGFVINEYLVGATKEWIIMNGMELFLGSNAGVLPTSEADIGKALSGQVVSREVILRATYEVVSDENFSIDSSLQGDSYYELWTDLQSMMKSVDDDLPNTIAVSSNISIAAISQAMMKLEDGGSLLMAATPEHSSWWQNHAKPVYILKCNEGFEILIFANNTSIIKNQFIVN